MDKTSKLFLREQIRRIRNLNGRIESGDFIMEALDNETLNLINSTSQNSIRQFLISKALPDSDINEIIDNMITKPFNSGAFCDGSRKVNCKHVAEYILKKMENANITDTASFIDFYEDIADLTKKPNNLKKEVETFLGLKKGKFGISESEANRLLDDIVNMKEYFMSVMGMGSNAEFNTKLLEEKKKLMEGSWCKKCNSIDEVIAKYEEFIKESKTKLPKPSQNQIDEFLKRINDSKSEIKQTQRLKDSEFDGLVMDIAKKLNEGTFLTEFFMDEIKDFRRNPEDFNKKEIWKLFLLHLQKLKQGSLRPVDIKKLMDHFDKNIYPGLAANTSEEFAKSARSDFKEKLESGTFCEDCESRKEIQKKALIAMKLLLKYSDAEIPKGLGRIDFLQGKIDQLLVINQKEDTEDEEGENIPFDTLKKMVGKTIKMKYEPNPTLKKDNQMKEFIGLSKGILSGKIVKMNDSKKYIIFEAFGDGGRFQFVIPTPKGLTYPKTYKVRVRKEAGNDWKPLYDYKPDFKIKITDVK